MCSTLFTIGPLTVHGYGLMIGIGFLVAIWMAWGRSERRGYKSDYATTIAIVALVFGFLGAKILYILTSLDEFMADPLAVLGAEGFVVYGGILTGLLACYIYCRKKQLHFGDWLDIMLPPVAMAQGFGRVGCFLAGCCYGLPTDSALGVVFPAGSGAPAGIPLWPTQLFSAGGDFLLAFFLLWYDKKAHPKGQIGLLYLILYGIGRSIIEVFRNDARGSVGILSTSQFISLFVVAAAVIILIVQKKKGAKPHEDQ